MKYLVFHSRTGAAAIVAALQFLGAGDDTVAVEQKLRSMPDRGKFFIRVEETDLTVLALASGKERFVLQHALRALTKQFKPEADIEMRDLTRAEWRRCWVWLKLLRAGLLPKPLCQWFSVRLLDRVKRTTRGASF